MVTLIKLLTSTWGPSCIVPLPPGGHRCCNKSFLLGSRRSISMVWHDHVDDDDDDDDDHEGCSRTILMGPRRACRCSKANKSMLFFSLQRKNCTPAAGCRAMAVRIIGQPHSVPLFLNHIYFVRD